MPCERPFVKLDDRFQFMSAGGGLPTPYRPQDQSLDVERYFELWDQTRKEFEQEFGHSIQLEIEPGRLFDGRVWVPGMFDSRDQTDVGDNLFYLVDAGFNNLARPIMYGAYHPISVCHRQPADAERTQPVIVGGPLCESGDIFTQQEGGFVEARELPVAGIDDLLVIECAGAYGYVMSSNYNTKPLTAEVLVDEGQTRLIRRRQKLSEIFAAEQFDA